MNNNENNRSKAVMMKLSSGIVSRRWLVIAVFTVLIALSVFSMTRTDTDYTLPMLLSDGSGSLLSQSIEDSEFVTCGSARIVIDGVSAEEASSLCNELRDISHVSAVLFDPETDYAESSALISVSFDSAADSELSISILDRITKTLKGYDRHILSNVGAAAASDSLSRDMMLVVVILVAAVMLILLICTRSYGELPVLVITMLAAAALNSGTDRLLGSVSYISRTLTPLLQLAFTAVPAFIICSRYTEVHGEEDSAAVVIVTFGASIPSVFAAALAPAAALAALLFSKFGFGSELALSLIKAAVCSFLTVMFLTPSLLYILRDAIDNSMHGRFLPNFSFLGDIAHVTRFVMPVIFVLLVAAGFMLTRDADVGFNTSNGNADANYVREVMDSRFGGRSTFTVLIPQGYYDTERELAESISSCAGVIDVKALCTTEVAAGYMLTDSVNADDMSAVIGTDKAISQAIFAYYAAEKLDHRDIENIDSYTVPFIEIFEFLHDKCMSSDVGISLNEEQAARVNELYDTFSALRDHFEGKNYSRITVNTSLPLSGSATSGFVEKLQLQTSRCYPDSAFISGDSVTELDLRSSFAEDMRILPLLATAFVLVLLILAFRSFALPLLLTLTALGSIFISLAIPAFKEISLGFICCLIAAFVIMGMSAAYAVIIASRCRQLCPYCEDRQAAMKKTFELCFPALLGSALMLFLPGFAIGNLVKDSVIAGIGTYVSVGALVGLGLSLLVLPQILLAFGKSMKAVAPIATKETSPVTLRRVIGFSLALISVATLVFLPFTRQRMSDAADSTVQQCGDQLSAITTLEALNVKLDKVDMQYEGAKLIFAESYVTGHYGKDQISDTEQQYYEGIAQLADGEGRYAQGKAQYDAALSQYNKALKEYNAGRVQYDEWLAQYNAALAEYNAAKSQSENVMAIYNTVMPLYNAYKQQSDAYEAAVAAGNNVIAATLYPLVTAGRTAFETSLGRFGSIGELLESADAANTELRAAEEQLRIAEEALNAAKTRLDELEAFINVSDEQLVAGKEQLEQTRQQLDVGYYRINQAGEQITKGKETIDRSEQILEGSLASLDEYADEAEKLIKGTDLLLEVPEIRDAVGSDATYGDICRTAKAYYSDLMQQTQRANSMSRISVILFALSAVCAFIASICLLRQKNGFLPFMLTIVAVFGTAAGFALWKIFSSGHVVLLILAAALCVIAFIDASYILKHRVSKQAEAAEEITEEA